MKNYAVIDIGSNSVRYMGARGQKLLTTTRLAEDLAETGRLSEAAIERSLAAIGAFVRRARIEGLTPRAYATSAVRDAQNADSFLACLREKFGLEADVLSGAREARYAALGAGALHGGLIEIGGGSSQIAFADFRASFPLGCVRAKDLLAGETAFEAMKTKLEGAAAGIFCFPHANIVHWVGVGGTITTLAALSLGQRDYDGAAVNACVLTREQVGQLAQKLHGAGEAARAAQPLLFERHDVIVPGALILSFLMRGMDIERLRASDADGMEGYLEYLLSGEAD